MSSIKFYPANICGSKNNYDEEAFSNLLLEEHIKPVPAIKAVPDYYKATPPYVAEDAPTIKKCIPVLDAFSLGYIIRSHVDIKFRWNKDNKAWDCIFSDKENFLARFDIHKNDQISNLIKRKRLRYGGALKFLNPWCIETDPGYSCLFVHPLNGGVNEIEFISGSVDTDKYNNPVNFPFLVKNGHDEFRIRVGDPLVQVIPYKRENVKLDVCHTTDNRSIKVNLQRMLLKSQFSDAYRQLFWHKNQKPKEPWYKRLFKK